MKIFRRYLAGLMMVVGLSIGLHLLYAQPVVLPVQNATARWINNSSTNALSLQITGITNGMVGLLLNNATGQVYGILTKTDLTLTNWTIESGEIWPTNSTLMPLSVPVLDRTNVLFIRAMDWTGVTENGNATPDWWFWKYFGTLTLFDTSLDSQGHTLLYDYQNGFDPNVISFSLWFTHEYVNRSPARGVITIIGGAPAYVAVLVNDTNQTDAVWQPYTSNVVANLDTGDGDYSVRVGLRGLPPDAQATWVSANSRLDSLTPVLIVTNPATGTVSVPRIQVQGLVSEPLSRLTFDLSNAVGMVIDQPGYTTGWFSDTNSVAFKTNFFQCYDLTLADGLNIITLHATDLADNTTTTALDVVLDYSGDTNPPVVSVIWPPDGAAIGSDHFSLQGKVDDDTAKIAAVITDANDNTHSVPGLVERDGTVWIQNLPLVPGANTLTITAADVAGNTSSVTETLFQSGLTVTMDPLGSDQLNQPSVLVTGTVSDPTAVVYVNGRQAEIYDDEGDWWAGEVPVSATGTAIFDIEVDTGASGALALAQSHSFSPADVPSTASFNQITLPQPVKVVLSSYSGSDYFSVIVSDDRGGYINESSGVIIDWNHSKGGFWITYETPYWYYDWVIPPAGPGFTTPWVDMGGCGTYFTPAWETGSLNCSVEGGNLERSVRTRVMIAPQGQLAAGTVNFYLVSARARDFSSMQSGDMGLGGALQWWWMPDLPLPPEWLRIQGKTLLASGVPDTDGSVWGETIIAAPAGAPVDVTPEATKLHNYNDYLFDVQAQEVNLQLAVDANRDGQITFDESDATSLAKPYRFWVNNDYDGYDRSIEDDDDLDPSTRSDADNLIISCPRDLEDYTRLWINTQGLTAELQNGSMLLALEWKGAVDDPRMQFFQAAEPDGGARYLTDTAVAAQQTSRCGTHLIEWAHRNILSQNNPFIFPPGFWANLSDEQPVAHLLFDAVSRGSGRLVIAIYKDDGATKLVESAPLYLKLHDVKEMYERWTVGDDPGSPPAPMASLVTAPVAYDSTIPAENNYILFVHGWNLADWEKDAFAETAFKRLYWQGYKGHFGAFQWPTGYGFGNWKSVVTDPDNFDNSELNAWLSAQGLFDLLSSLNGTYPNHVYLMAHSMGNIVAGEALKLAGSSQVVNTYIAMQGAIASHCYDQIADFRTVRLVLDSGTPDRYANYPTNSGPCYFDGIAGAGSFVNFYNPNDWALDANHWQLDQDLKPDTTYSWDGTHFLMVASIIDFPAYTYRIFAYCDEARCYALGAQANVGGVFQNQQIDLHASFDLGNLHKDHSGQFNSDNMNRWRFWQQFLLSTKLTGTK
jgi:Alpha/beta hydrolase of unknown function (DUF900)